MNVLLREKEELISSFLTINDGMLRYLNRLSVRSVTLA